VPASPTGSGSGLPDPLLGDLLCFDLYAASRAMTAVYRTLLDAHGLTYPQYLVLVVLWRTGPVPIRQIGTALHLDHGTLTPLLRRMEERDLVTRRRDAADGRSVTVALAPGGEVLRPFLADVQCAVQDAVGLPAADIEALQRTLRDLTRTLAGSDPSADPSPGPSPASPA
jgi:DNA-binding MarR family transcriptional regulator